jgi:hypothetical protein
MLRNHLIHVYFNATHEILSTDDYMRHISMLKVMHIDCSHKKRFFSSDDDG